MGSIAFRDRADAGRQLARALQGVELDHAVIVGLARGGAEVAAEVARTLHLPLDVLAVRKVGHPLQPEYAIGAVTPRGGVYVRASGGLKETEVNAAVASARTRADALDRRVHLRRPPIEVAGKTCVLVDDGLATGATMVAAVRWARRSGACRVVVAVPVGAPDTVARIEDEADDVVCLEAPQGFGAVGLWYQSFLPVGDERVQELLDEAATGVGQPDPVIRIDADGVALAGDFTVPAAASGVVLFAHGSGSSRASPRNRLVAHLLNEAGLATLLFDLLTDEEALDRRNVFDIRRLASRLAAADRSLRASDVTQRLPVGYFGASTGAAAALWAAADLGDAVRALVSRGGRPDLAWPRLALVHAPTLLVVGGADEAVLELNRRALEQLRCEKELRVIPGATHLFEEPGSLEAVADAAAGWFRRHLIA